MIKGLRYILGFIALLAGFGSVHAQDSLNVTDAKGHKQGHWIRTYPNDQVRYDGFFKDDKPVGLLKRYRENGKLEADMDYAPDGVTCDTKVYHENGQVVAMGRYIGQEKDGVWQYFNEKGQKTSQESFKKGVKDGTFEEYYPETGNIVNRMQWKDGKKDGDWVQQFEDGTIRTTGHYTDDHLEGDVTFHYPSGKVQMTGPYVKGIKNGTWKYFLGDGRLGSIVRYSNGYMTGSTRVNGTFTEYHPGRIPAKVMNYVNGKLEGEYLEYYPVGKWVVEEVPGKTNNQQFGEEEEADREEKLEVQVLKMKANYVNGQLEGEVTYYKEDGTVDKVEKYHEGNLVK
ncbi:MAG: toxin-antitoxin system YwqK family antitoxin [Flavobacteriales bacterium]|nr:toxin-antitoxin system YwqK family antitoxin [Flavobacteriales bacterium]MCB9447631.1 toxin-antitoxin system YwqK family antitoxin [Flavobacteriales bacterium]